MSIKLDISKAYERLEWSYLEQVLISMSFKMQLLSLLMACVSTATFSILVNGILNGHIIPSWRLRQGDSLFPYLILLCMEGLIYLLKENQQVKGLRFCQGAPIVNHLLLTNDSMLFCKADVVTNLECNKYSRNTG